MPIHIQMQPDTALVCVRVQGELTLADCIAGLDRLYGDAAFRPGMDILAELNPGAAAGLTPLEISGILDAVRRRHHLRGSGRTALVASHDADLGLVSLLSHALQQGPRPMQVFQDRHTALRWLGH